MFDFLYLYVQNPKVLIAAPTNKVKDYCQFDWIEQVISLNYDNYSVFLSDNSYDSDFYNKIKSYDIQVSRVNPEGKSNPEYMAESHEQCRLKAIEDNYDYILHWEVDLFTDNKFIIQDLLYHNLPVVGGTYHIGIGLDSTLCAIVFNQQGDEEGISVHQVRLGSDLLLVDGNLKKVFSCGLGCTMIRRDVFTKIKFRHDKKQRYHPDSSFAEDCYYNKIPIYMDTSILLDHQNSQWLFY